MEKNNRIIIRKTRVNSPDAADDDGFVNGDPSSLFSIMWDITKDAWAFRGEKNAEQRLQRHITNFYRRES